MNYTERSQAVIEEAEAIVHGQAMNHELWANRTVYGLSDIRVWEFLESATPFDGWRWVKTGFVSTEGL